MKKNYIKAKIYAFFILNIIFYKLYQTLLKRGVFEVYRMVNLHYGGSIIMERKKIALKTFDIFELKQKNKK